MRYIEFIFLSNRFQLLLVFFAFFFIGIILSYMVSQTNKEKKKKGFRPGLLLGKTKKTDKIIAKKVKDKENIQYLHDDMEHYANKKFK